MGAGLHSAGPALGFEFGVLGVGIQEFKVSGSVVRRLTVWGFAG